MPRKKISDCSEHVKLMKVLKSRLMEITLKVDNYIYKQKPITKLQAKAFLNEISSYKSHCQNDMGYIQVIEKLTKYMNIIISKKTNITSVKDVKLSNENIDTSNNSELTNEKLPTSVDTLTNNVNDDPQNKTHNSTDIQNNLEVTLHNKYTLGTEAKNQETRDEKRSNVTETVNLEKGEVTSISPKLLENDTHIKNIKESHPPPTANKIKQGEIKNYVKEGTNNFQTSHIQNTVQSLVKNYHRLLICEDGGVIHDIKHLSNATIIHQAPEQNIPLDTIVLNNNKMSNSSSETDPKVTQKLFPFIQNSEEPKSAPVINKSGKRKINNKKVKFTAPYNDVGKISKSDKKKFEEESNDKGLINVTSDSSEKKVLPKKQRTRIMGGQTNKNRNCIKESQGVNDIKSKHPAIKRKVNKSKKNLPQEETSNNNEFNKKALDELLWFNKIKQVRKIEEKEYFKPLKPLDDNFWRNPNLLSTDDRDFNI